MGYTPTTTESICRLNLAGYMDDIQDLTVPANDNNLAAWMTARTRAEKLVRDLDTVCAAISNRPVLRFGHDEEDAAMDQLQVLARTNPTLHPIFQHLLGSVRPCS